MRWPRFHVHASQRLGQVLLENEDVQGPIREDFEPSSLGAEGHVHGMVEACGDPRQRDRDGELTIDLASLKRLSEPASRADQVNRLPTESSDDPLVKASGFARQNATEISSRTHPEKVGNGLPPVGTVPGLVINQVFNQSPSSRRQSTFLPLGQRWLHVAISQQALDAVKLLARSHFTSVAEYLNLVLPLLKTTKLQDIVAMNQRAGQTSPVGGTAVVEVQQ